MPPPQVRKPYTLKFFGVLGFYSKTLPSKVVSPHRGDQRQQLQLRLQELRQAVPPPQVRKPYTLKFFGFLGLYSKTLPSKVVSPHRGDQRQQLQLRLQELRRAVPPPQVRERALGRAGLQAARVAVALEQAVRHVQRSTSSPSTTATPSAAQSPLAGPPAQQRA